MALSAWRSIRTTDGETVLSKATYKSYDYEFGNPLQGHMCGDPD
jgi:hypothetical protein